MVSLGARKKPFSELESDEAPGVRTILHQPRHIGGGKVVDTPADWICPRLLLRFQKLSHERPRVERRGVEAGVYGGIEVKDSSWSEDV